MLLSRGAFGATRLGVARPAPRSMMMTRPVHLSTVVGRRAVPKVFFAAGRPAAPRGLKMPLRAQVVLRRAMWGGAPESTSSFSRKNLILYGGGTAAVIVVYYAVSETINLVQTVINIKPKDMIKYGFYTGFLTATGMAIVFVGGFAAITMRPEPVYRRALKMIQAHKGVYAKVGFIKPGPLRAYTLNHGHLVGEGTFVAWKPPSVQLIFSLAGEKYDGIATLECVKRGVTGYWDFTYVGVDVANKASDRILITGSEDKMEEKADILRDLYLFKEEHTSKPSAVASRPPEDAGW